MTKRTISILSHSVVAAALALLTACGPVKYLTFEVWEAPDKTSTAKKEFVQGFGGYHDQIWGLLEKNDIEGSIKLIEGSSMKSYLDMYNLAVLYEVKHDWTNAEKAVQEGIKIHDEKFKSPNAMLQNELAYIQDHKARYVHTAPMPAVTPAPEPAAPAAPPVVIPSLKK